MGKIPPLNKWKKKISRLDRMMLIDCVPNGVAVVIGAAVGFFHVFWAINGPECIDSTWDRIQKPGRKHRKFAAKGFSVGPTISPGAGNSGGTMIMLGDMAQKIGFGLGIVDGFLNGVIYGSAMVRRYSGCNNPDAPFAQLSTTNIVPALFPAQTFVYASWTVDNVHGFGAGPTGVAIGGDPTQLITVAYGIATTPGAFFPLPDCSFTSSLIWLPSGNPVRQLIGGLGTNVTGNGVLYGQDIVPSFGDTQIAVRVEKTEGVMFVSSAFLTVTGGKIDSGLDAYDCGAKFGSLH